MKISFITNKYPNKVEPNAIVFLKELVTEMADQGILCQVICPVPINLNKSYLKLPKKIIEPTRKSQVEVIFPRYIGFGQKNIGFFNPSKITTFFFRKSVEKIIKRDTRKPDAIYSHFVTPAGITAAKIGKKYGIPSYMAYGEATLATINHYGKKAVKKELKSLAGVIAVSTQNKNMIKNYYPEEKIRTIPNAIDDKKYYPRDKKESRKKFGFKEDDFIVSFVGSFDERKGIDRLSKAIESLGGQVKLAAAGKGKLKPNTKYCIWNKPVNHDDLPYFYSASDIFVLPTRNEGCCNAIIEAMACGLPIITSDRDFNKDILNKKNAMLINPDNIDEITHSINTLCSDKKNLIKLIGASKKSSANLTIKTRAMQIINYIKETSNL